MLKQQEKVLMETKFCFYIHQPKNGEVIGRIYKNKLKKERKKEES